MFSKIFVYTLVLLVSVNASERCSPWDPRCQRPRAVSGFYGGIGLGYTNLVGQLNRNLNINASDRVTSVGESGITAGLFVGYQKVFDNTLYLAAEGSYQYSDILIEKDENTFPGFVNYFTYIKNDHKAALVGKFGFVHSNNIFYLKTGLALSRFMLGFRDNNESPSITSGKFKMQKGIVVGGGVDYFINRSFVIGVEYDVTTYPSMNFKNNAAGSFTFKPNAHTFQVRFKYTL